MNKMKIYCNRKIIFFNYIFSQCDYQTGSFNYFSVSDLKSNPFKTQSSAKFWGNGKRI